MPIFDPFTEKITTNQHQGDSFAVLHRNGSCVAFDQIVHYDEDNGLLGCVPCNLLVESESESDYLKNNLLWALGEIIQIPNLIVGGGSMGGAVGQKGLTFNLGYSESDGNGFDVVFEHERLGNTNAFIEQQGAADIQLGFNSSPIVNEDGAVYGLTINVIDNTIELPDWDLFFDIDKYLENGNKTCENTKYGLSTSKHCAVCENRARRKMQQEIERMESCLSNTCSNGSTTSSRFFPDSFGSDFYEEYEDYGVGNCGDHLVDIHDLCGCICAEVGTITTWAPYKGFTPIDGWPNNWNQATITDKRCVSKPGDQSRYYCHYTLDTLMFGSQTFDSRDTNIAQGQTQQTGLQVAGSGGTLELNADGYSAGTHFDLRILGINIASVGGDGSIDSSDGAFDGNLAVSVDQVNGTLIIDWSGASNSTWIFVVDYEFATMGQGDFGTTDNTAAAPSAESVAKWMQHSSGPTPCDWEETDYDDDCCERRDDGSYSYYSNYPWCNDEEDLERYKWHCSDSNDSCYDLTASIENSDGTYGCQSTGTSHCYMLYDIKQAYDKCYEDCGSQTNIHGTNCYNSSKGENRPDIATDTCHCGGGYKSEDTSCGWRAIMNKVPYSI